MQSARAFFTELETEPWRLEDLLEWVSTQDVYMCCHPRSEWDLGDTVAVSAFYRVYVAYCSSSGFRKVLAAPMFHYAATTRNVRKFQVPHPTRGYPIEVYRKADVLGVQP